MSRYREVTDFWIISYGYRDLFGRQATREDLLSRLRRYSLGEVLQAVGRISTVLNRMNRDSSQTFEEQRHLCRHIFRERADVVWEAFRRRVERDKPPAAALFFDMQVINAAKLALLVLEADGGVDDAKPLADLGEALLMITDLVMDQAAPPVPERTEGDFPREWQEFFLRNRLFHHGGHWLSSVARAYDLYCTDRPNLKTVESYVDLPRGIRELTGAEPYELWLPFFVLVSRWNTADVERGLVNGRLNIPEHFGTTVLDPEEFLSRAVVPAATVRNEIIEHYSMTDLKPFDYLTLAKNPVLRIADDCYCVSVKLLAEKLTAGMYHLFLNPQSDKEVCLENISNSSGHGRSPRLSKANNQQASLFDREVTSNIRKV